MRFIMVTNQFPSLCGRYFITSYGNGWAYEVEELHSGRTIWFQDSEACMVQEATSSFADCSPLLDYFEAQEYECAYIANNHCEFDR